MRTPRNPPVPRRGVHEGMLRVRQRGVPGKPPGGLCDGRSAATGHPGTPQVPIAPPSGAHAGAGGAQTEGAGRTHTVIQMAVSAAGAARLQAECGALQVELQLGLRVITCGPVDDGEDD